MTKDREAMELARELLRGSLLEDAAARFISQILKEAHDSRIKPLQDRIEDLEAKLGMIQDEWTSAVYGDLENGVAVLNRIASEDFRSRYPLVSTFGETINQIIGGGNDE